MNIEIAKKALQSRDIDNWTIKGEHLCYTNGDIRFLFDKIDSGFLGFRKLVLVSDGRIVKLSFFQKKRLYPLVVKKGYNVEKDKRDEAFRKLRNDRAYKSSPPPPPPSRPKSKPNKINSEEIITNWTSMGSSIKEFNTISSLIGNKINPNIPDEDALSNKVKDTKTSVSKKLTEVERRTQQFKNDVEKEKLRIRKLLRKEN